MGAPMEKRRDATKATVDRFKSKPFQPGKRDCAMMAKFHLRAMGRPVKGFAGHGPYHSIAGGVRQLKRMGFDSLLDAMDAHFDRVTPAAVWLGDIVALPGEDGPGALCVYLGNGRIFGYHQGAVGAEILQPVALDAVWRIA